jgi:Domain of unknown function (DUF4337)
VTEFGESAELAAELAMESSGGLGAHGRAWHNKAALTTLTFAVLAAGAALLAGLTAHEIMVERNELLVDVVIGYDDLQRAEAVQAKHDILDAVGQSPSPADVAAAETLNRDAVEALDEALKLQEEAVTTGSAHLRFALAATIFAMAIAVVGLSVVVDRKWLWGAGFGVAALGAIALIVGAVDLYL